MKILDNNGSMELKIQQSDLFFNHTHPHFAALFRVDKPAPTQEEQYAAILKDATEFANDFGGDAKWYANDFMKRL